MQLSRVRSAYERDRSLRVEEGRTIERPRQFLQLPLDAAEQPSDVLPALSPLMTTANTELAMASLLSNVSRDAVEAVGVQATDPKEVLFLSRLIKDHCPDVRLFTFESYLMFLHEDYQPFLHGMIVASTYPLYARNQHWTQARKEAGEEEVETHLQFRCSLDQGVYNATTALLNDELPPDQRLPLLEYSLPFSPQHRRPPVWLSVVGSGGLWPVEVRGIGESDAPTVLSGQLAASLPRVSHDVMFTLFGLLPMTLFCLAHLGVLYVAIRKESNLDDWWLIKVLQPILGRGHGLAAVSSLFVLLLGLELVLASVAVLPTLVNHRGGRGELSDHLVLALLGVALLVPFMGCAYASSLRFSKNLRWLMGGAALGGLLVWVVVVLACSSLLEGKALATANLVLFYERASSLFSGVSPIIPIVHLGLGAYLMLLGLFHRKGRLFVLDVGEALIRFVRVSPRPLREIGRRASRVLGQRLPWRLESVSLHLVAFAATVALLLFLLCTRALVPSTRWTFECRPFEWIYAICLAGLALWLVVELVRLTSLWHGFIRLLGRLATEPLLGALRRLPDAVSGVMKMQLFARPLEEPELVEGLRQAQAILETRPKAPPPGGKELRAWQRASNRITGLLEQLPHSEHVSERSLLRATMASVPRIHEATVSLRGSKDKAQREWARRGEEFVAAHVVNVLRYWIQQLRNGLVFLTLSSFFLFLSVTSYPFQPQRMLSWVGGVLVLVVLLAAIGVFVRMNRNLVLSTIAGTSPGRITWDRGFIVSILTVVVLPLLALLARIFPSLGGSLESATDSALRLLR
jgi:hypothetical protein